jgi:hypothetical protein
LRLIPFCRQHGLQILAVDAPTVRIHTHTDGHLRGSLDKLLRGALYIVQTHREQLRKSPRHYADWCSVTAVYAAKAGRFNLARGLLIEAARWYPRKAANFVRLAVACCPVLARRVWRWEGNREA